jgi:3-methyl-2-oxobutanoate hydroxymethyltransferase
MNIQDFKAKKDAQQKIAMVTCYDYFSARIVEKSHIDCVLVGDSVAMVVHGHETTIMATMDMMVLHTQAVARGLKQQFLISDLPFLSHKISLTQTVENVQSLLRAGAQAVKIEGSDEHTCETISYLVNAGIPVMGHIGLMPQFIHQLGGYKVQGKSQEQAQLLNQQALRLEAAGCFALVIECVPQKVAQSITQSLSIPTIGIGAGPDTDGQVLVWHDLLGLQTDFKLKFVKQFAQTKELMREALNNYANQVHQVHFPEEEHIF